MLSFRAAAGPRWIDAVEVRLNGQRIGDAQRCADSWCFDVNFKRIDGPALIEAVSAYDSDSKCDYQLCVFVCVCESENLTTSQA